VYPPAITGKKNKQTTFYACKAHNLELYPHTLITLDDTQTQNKEFPVVGILLQQSLETLFWKGA
jgi:hypothetical protein